MAMRRLILSGLLFLAACGQQAPQLPPEPAAEEPPPAAAPQAAAAPQQAPLSTPALGAVSNTAMSITGALTIEQGALKFEKGFAAQTQYLGVVDATTLIAANGQSFAQTAPGPTTLRIELRRITGTAPVQLCGGDTPATYVALASDSPITALTLMVFSGPDAPGPTVQHSAVCATFSYAVD
jgi:hypothetical protein